MTEINFHDYNVEHLDAYTSDFLNQITTDFNNNMVKLYMELQSIIKEYNNFNTAVNIGLDWMTTMIGSLSFDADYAVTGYSVPSTSTDMTLSRLFGQFYNGEVNKESKIGRYLGDKGKYLAYASNQVFKYVSGSWIEDVDLRTIIDNQSNIWQDERDEDELYISLALTSSSSTEYKANIIEVVPFAGTLIKKIEWKTPAGTFEQVLPNSKLPVQIVGDLDFANEVRVLLGGELRNGKYYYALRYMDVYRSDFRDSGSATFAIGDFSEIADIDFNDDYIQDDLKLETPFRIEILSDDESITYYDSNVDAYPIQTTISIDSTPVPVKLRMTLTTTNGVTPVIKYIDVQ